MNDRDRLISLLKELFRFDKAELDFGIYRIMNKRKDEIEKFIEKDLVKTIDQEMDQLINKDKEILEEKIKKIKDELEEHGVDYKNSKKYRKVKEELDSLSNSTNFDSNIYNDIYRFFKRYYDNGDFLSKRRYSKDEKYAIPYNGEEVHMHWANKDQYYVKTTEEFDNYSFKKKMITVNFKVLQAEEEEKNNKSDEDQYFLLKDENYFDYDNENKELNIYFEYRSLTKKENKKYKTRNTQADIRDENFEKLKKKIKNQTKDIYDLGWLITETKKANPPLKSELYKYTTKNKSDYFIHKNLKEFLNRELDFYIKNEIMNIDAIGTEDEKGVDSYINKVRVIKNVSKKIIEFLAQIENFQKKLFEKKKFVIDDGYCLTLDKVPEKIKNEIFEEVLNNKEQLEEWNDLFNEDIKSKSGLYEDDKLKNLVIDTKYFDENFKEKIISNYKNIDKEIEGIMINSDNYHALNLLERKFKGQIDISYIDPPYNTEAKETGAKNFPYKDNYKHSSWLSMMNDRLLKTYDFLDEYGTFFVNINDAEQDKLKILLDNIFGDEEFLANIIWHARKSVSNDAIFSLSHHYLLSYCKNFNKFNLIKDNFTLKSDKEGFINPDDDPRGPWKADPFDAPNIRPNLTYPIENPNNGEIYYPPEGRCWRTTKEKYEILLEDNRIIFGKTGEAKPQLKRFWKEAKSKGKTPKTIWSDVDTTTYGTKEIQNIFGYKAFKNPKPISLLVKIFELLEDDVLVLDFFAGSGTTAHSVIYNNHKDKGKRKYILIEMGNYFDTITVPRIKKIMYSETWKDGKPESEEGYSHIFKYQKLEQYEDTLENIEFESNNLKLINNYDDYLIKYMLDYDTKSSVLNIDQFKDPFNYEIIVTENKEKINKKVNLIETFNYLIGLKVKTFDVYDQFDRKYKVVSGKKDDESVLVIWRKTIDLDLRADKEFIENKLNIDDYKKVYINGDNYVENSLLIEESFRKLMLND